MAGETELDRMVVRLMGDGSSYFNMLRKADLQTGRAMKAIGARASRLGRSMAMRLTLPLTVMAGASVKAFSNFDKAMIESTSIMKVTGDQADQMRKKALAMSMSGEALQGPKDLAKSYFFLASAGKTAEQSMSLLPAVSKFATAGAFDMALATDLLTDAQSALGLASKNLVQDERNLVRVSDVLVKANTLANASVQQFSTAITSKAGAALKSFNKDIEEGTAVLAAMADQGIKAELAGNALGRMIRLLSKSSLDNAKAHRVLGFRVFDTAGKMRNLGDIVANLEQVLKGMSDQQKVATLAALGFEARVQAVILPLLGTSNAIKKYERELRKAKGITDEVARKQMKAFGNQMTVLKNQVTVLAIEIGRVLAPMLKWLAVKIKAMVVVWRSWSPEVKQTVVVIGLVLAVAGPLLIVLGAMSSAIGSLITMYTGLNAVMAGTMVGSVALKAALGGLIAVGVGAFLIGVRLHLAQVNSELREAIEKVNTLGDKRLASIGQLRGAEQRGALQREGRRRLDQIRAAQANLRDAQSKFGLYGKVAGAVTGADPIQPFRDNLTQAKKELKAFSEFQKRLVSQSPLGVGGTGEKGALAEAARQAQIDEKRTQAREKIQNQVISAVRGLQRENDAMRMGADAAQLWALKVDGASNAALKHVASLMRQRKALQDQEKATRKREEFFARGRRVIEQYLTPQEKLIKQQKELESYLKGGAIGQKTFNRAMAANVKERDDAIRATQKRAKGLGGELPRNIGVEVGTVAFAREFRANQRRIAGADKGGQPRAEELLERIANAVERDQEIKAGALEN